MLRTGALLLVLLLGLPPLSAAEEEAAPPRDPHVPDPVTRVVETVVTDAVYLLTAPLRLDRETAVLAGGLTFGVVALSLADREIRERVQASTGSTGRDVADGLTTAGDAGVVVGLNAALLALGLVQQHTTGDTRLRDASLVALEAQLFTALLTSGFKYLTGRARPDAGQRAHRFDPFDRDDDALPSGRLPGFRRRRRLRGPLRRPRPHPGLRGGGACRCLPGRTGPTLVLGCRRRECIGDRGRAKPQPPARGEPTGLRLLSLRDGRRDGSGRGGLTRAGAGVYAVASAEGLSLEAR